MSKYVSQSGYTGYANQSVIWHYMTDIDRDLLNRWFVNIFSQGMLYYIPDPAGSTNDPPVAPPIGGTVVTIPQGTSFIIKEKTATIAGEEQIAKVDMVLDHELDITEITDLGGNPLAVGVYSLVAIWENAADEDRGVEYYLASAADIIALGTYNYVKLGEVTLYDNGGNLEISDNTTTGQTHASMYSGLIGWSGWSGAGTSGYSGYSSFSGYSGVSGYSGYSGRSGYSGYSAISGYSGYSGAGGYDIYISVLGKPTGTELVFVMNALRAFKIPASATGSISAALSASTGDVWFVLYKNGTAFGALRYNATASGAFYQIGNPADPYGVTPTNPFPETAFAIGDVLAIYAPQTPDATLENITIDMLCQLT